MDYHQLDSEFAEIYARFASAMDAEDALINHRMSWLLVSQSILFAALGLGSAVSSGTAVSTNTFLYVVPWVGAAGSLLQWISIMAAVTTELRDRRVLIKHYIERRKELSQSDRENAGALPPRGELMEGVFPLVEPKPARFYLGFAAPTFIPLVFFVAWLVVIIGSLQ
jgi:hypothetical protein